MKRIKKNIVSALGRFWHRSRIALVIFFLLVIGIIFAGLHDTGIVLGILAGLVIMIEISRKWRRIRSFIFMLLISFFGIIFLSFIDVDVVKPAVRFLGGPGAETGSGFEIFNQIVSLVIVFFGTAGLVTGFLGTVILSIWRLISYIDKWGAARNT